MSNVNIRVYMVRFEDGRVAFEAKREDARAADVAATLETLAKLIKGELNRTLGARPKREVSIDFIPFHDIECPSGLLPSRCYPLTEQEKETFWTAFRS